MMCIAPRIYEISLRGKEALENGEDIYENWTHERICREIFRIKEESDESEPIDYNLLDQISLEVMKDYLLYKSSWHHVNRDKVWFYKLDEPTIFAMSEEDIRQMIDDTAMRLGLLNKPRLVEVITYKWVKTADQQHDTVSCRRGYGVLYNSSVYFTNGRRYPISRDKCVITHLYNKGVPKNKRQMFNDIRREMRHYEIYC